MISPTKIVEKENIPSSDAEFTYENGIKAWVGALFVDIVDSSNLFKSPNEDTARIIRSFCSEIISILKDDNNYREIGIRGDCVYCIYNAPYQTDLVYIYFATLIELIPLWVCWISCSKRMDTPQFEQVLG